MKKGYLVFLIPVFAALALSACGKKYDYSAHLSEIKRDIFSASTEDFSVTLACISREHPYASDGIACPRSEIGEVTLVSKKGDAGDFSVFVAETEWGGEMSFRSVQDDWFYSESMPSFPEGSVTIRVEWSGGSCELEATSVKNEGTMSAEEALETAVAHEKEYIGRLMQNGTFQGEFRVRLLRRDVNYYYVGIVSKDGRTLSLLLGAESGEVLARREPV